MVTIGNCTIIRNTEPQIAQIQSPRFVSEFNDRVESFCLPPAMHHLRRILQMYRHSDPQEPYEDGDDESSIISSTVSNASTSRLSSASTQRDDDEHEGHEMVTSHLSGSLVEAEEELAEYIAARRNPVTSRQRLEDLVNRLVHHGEVRGRPTTRGEEEGDEDDDEDNEDEEDDEEDSDWATDSDTENGRPKRKKKKSVEKPRIRTFVVGMRHGEVIVESFQDGVRIRQDE